MKECAKCGNELKDDDVFCGKCGASQIAQPAPQPITRPATQKTNNEHSETRKSLWEYMDTLTRIKRTAGAIALIIGILLLIYAPLLTYEHDTTSEESASGTGIGSHDHSYWKYNPSNVFLYNVFGLILSYIGIYFTIIAHIEGKTLEKYVRKDL